MSLFAESSFSAPATDDSSNIASSSSTPPTTVADSASLHSDTSRHEVITVADAAPVISVVTAKDVPSPRRARRSRAFSPVYNLSRLSGTSAHGWRRSKGDAVADRRRRTIHGDTLIRSIEDGADSHKTPAEHQNIDALDLHCLPRKLEKPSAHHKPAFPPHKLRSSSRHSLSAATLANLPTLTANISALSKRNRNRKSVDNSLSHLPRELRRLQDTKEFAHIDDVPVVHTVWSNGKFVDPDEAIPAEPPLRKKAKVETPETDTEDEDTPEPITQIKRQRAPKKYLTKGLYAGQDYPTDITRCLSTAEKKELAQYPELQPRGRVNKVMPSPIFTGLRLLLNGRDFKLPYNVCNPLPPGQPKPDEWKKMTKNRFIGESKEIWRKLPHIHDYQSKCVCLPEDGCGDSCQNRIMLYECDETNCNVGKAACNNRAFADLTARRAKGGKYRVGVEVIKTADRGYGVRSNRCFQPHQIIMEYTGEIITEDECERRMTEKYQDNECYYLMSFDQNMIIDATTGSIARFVNHSCNPNCRMIKWIVSGQPRMALFAGDKPIMTGDELTYDYNFDPFSAKNVQKCLCGQTNCRGVLGPRPREVRQSKADKDGLKKAVKQTVKEGKRKLKELMSNEEGQLDQKAKKRKVMQPAKRVSKSLSQVKAKAAKGAATAIKKGASTVTTTKKKQKAKATIAVYATKKSVSKTTTSINRIIKTYGSGSQGKVVKSKPSARRNEMMETIKEAIYVKEGASAGQKTGASKAHSQQSLTFTSKAFEVD